MSKIKIRLGISPCPNDTWIFGALVLNRLEGCPFEFDVTFADVQTLNEKAMSGDFDVLKISFGTWLGLNQHRLLQAGGAMGFGCGPLLLSRNSQFDPRNAVYLPGTGTTARVLFDFWAKHQGFEHLDTPFAFFDEIYRDLLAGIISQGVAIHECRFTWEGDGLHLIQDLGAFWESKTQSPIPLGGIIVHEELASHAAELENWIRQSIYWAEANRDELLPWIQKHAQIEDMGVVMSHIRTYVNEFSLDLGDLGDLAIQNLRFYSKDGPVSSPSID